MSAVQLYSLIYCLVDGALLTEEASVEATRTGGMSPVRTTAKGLAGVSPGSPEVSFKIKNAIPAAGFEFNAGPRIRACKVVELGLLCAGQQMKAVGFILGDSFGHSVNSEAMYDFDFLGGWADFES
jgi:hypothetical protein